MNKTIYGKIVAVVSLSLMVAMPVVPAVAQDDAGIATDTVEAMDEARDAGILPTNPFYFLKEWSRGLRRAFIFNPVKRAEYELQVTDEKADELGEVSELDGEEGKGIERAAQNYQEAAERLKMRLEKIEESSENPNVQELMGNLADRAAKHEELIARLRVRYENFEAMRLRLESARESVEGVIDTVGTGVESIRELKERFRGGDVELKAELREKIKEFREGVESSGAFNRLDDFEGELRSRVESRTDGLRERFELRQKINGEELRLRFENKLNKDDDDEGDTDNSEEDLDEDEDDDDDLDEDEDENENGDGEDEDVNRGRKDDQD